MDSLGH